MNIFFLYGSNSCSQGWKIFLKKVCHMQVADTSFFFLDGFLFYAGTKDLTPPTYDPGISSILYSRISHIQTIVTSRKEKKKHRNFVGADFCAKSQLLQIRSKYRGFTYIFEHKYSQCCLLIHNVALTRVWSPKHHFSPRRIIFAKFT